MTDKETESCHQATVAFACQNLLLLLLSRFSRVRLCEAPEMAAHQAPPSLGFKTLESKPHCRAVAPSPGYTLEAPGQHLNKRGQSIATAIL